MKATVAEQKHWERGQGIADDLEALASRFEQAFLPSIGHPLVRRLRQQVVELRDFLADSHLPGENRDPGAQQ